MNKKKKKKYHAVDDENPFVQHISMPENENEQDNNSRLLIRTKRRKKIN